MPRFAPWLQRPPLLNVVTVFAPRDEYPGWEKYLPLLELQRKTTEKFRHRHVVVSDRDLPGLDVMKVELPQSLMKLILVGQIAFLEKWDDRDPAVLVDVDCLINRSLGSAFSGRFHLGLTRRDNAVAPINNGAMYLASSSKDLVLPFFRRALELCGDHWGGDQEAISQAAAPVPPGECIERRGNLRIAFLSMKSYNVTPQKRGAKHHANPFVVHFKGDRKHWMETYAQEFIL